MWKELFPFVTQLHPTTGSGASDCFEASLAKYLLEKDPTYLGGDPWAVINEVSVVARGTPDNPVNNPDTTLAQAEAALVHYGIPVNWTSSFQSALNAPWSICLVNGLDLTPPAYPPSFFGSEGYSEVGVPGTTLANHFVLWLPAKLGPDGKTLQVNWFNDPLAADKTEHQYDLNSVALSFYGAYLLPSLNHGETPPERITIQKNCALKVRPDHVCMALTMLSPGNQGLDLGPTPRITDPKTGEVWARIQYRDQYGYVPVSMFQNPNATPQGPGA